MRKRHREVWVDLYGKTDRMVIVGRVTQAMRRVAVGEEDVEEFRREAHRTKTHEELMEVVERWVEVSR